MNPDGVTTVLSTVGVAVFLIVDLGLTLAILAAGSLSRIALHRIASEANGAVAFLSSFGEPHSGYRIAAHLARQASLVGAMICSLVAAHGFGLESPWVAAAVVTGVVAIYALESVVARSVSARYPRVVLRYTAPLVRAAHIATYPITGIATGLARRAAARREAAEVEREDEQDEEVEAYFEVGEREGILEADEGKMMRSIVDLGDTRVREIMTPRPDIEALDIETTVGAARRAMLEVSHSKMPVYRDSIDNIFGVLHLRDLIRAWEEDRDDAPISAYVRPALFVPETQAVDDLLDRLRTRTHIALVVDEYGGIAGLVTLEDVLEEIVGDIRDEHDAEDELIEEQPDGSWAMSGLVHVSILEEMFGLEFEERDFDTLGGLVVSQLGRVPPVGEKLEYGSLDLTVLHADARRVYKVRVRQRAPEAGSVEPAPTTPTP